MFREVQILVIGDLMLDKYIGESIKIDENLFKLFDDINVKKGIIASG